MNETKRAFTTWMREGKRIRAMNIAGLQKLTLLDYPGKTAATLFTQGCNFRCPFCHNASLLKSAQEPQSEDDPTKPAITEDELMRFLEKRKGTLDGICITGGEPTLQHDLPLACQRLKQQGFLIKLDTNGSNPAVLSKLLGEGLLDYVALDIKNEPDLYEKTAGIRSISSETIEETVRTLLASSIPFELRTTVTQELHSNAALMAIASWIERMAQSGSENDTLRISWYIQNFQDSDNVLAGQGAFTPWHEDALQEILPLLQARVPQTYLRGV